jgi:hypothetical protein
VLIIFSRDFRLWKSYCSASSDTLCADLGPISSETKVRQIDIQFPFQKYTQEGRPCLLSPCYFLYCESENGIVPEYFSFLQIIWITSPFMVKITLFGYGNALNNGRRVIWLNTSRHIYCLAFKMSLLWILIWSIRNRLHKICPETWIADINSKFVCWTIYYTISIRGWFLFRLVIKSNHSGLRRKFKS